MSRSDEMDAALDRQDRAAEHIMDLQYQLKKRLRPAEFVALLEEQEAGARELLEAIKAVSEALMASYR